jgi:uncharacterized cupredoxin-like copper-binding protein
MSGKSKMVVLVAGLAVAALLGVACGGDGKKATESPTTSPTATSGAAVDVILSEWLLEPDPVSVSAGKVTFTANNEGEKVHEFVIFKTDLAPDALPTTADGKVDEEGAGLEAVDEIEDIAAGTSADLTVDLQPGKYVLICNVVAEVEGKTELHYKEGMHAAFTVQ